MGDHVFYTHHAPHMTPPWMALSMTECMELLKGYPLTDEQRADGAVLMMGYCRLIDDADLIEYGSTEAEALGKLKQRLAGANGGETAGEIDFSLPVISVRQPWAWLIVNGWKNIENRSWPTRVRGPVLIHAGKGMTAAEYDACLGFIADFAPSLVVPPPGDLQRGGIVGMATILDCVTRHSSEWYTGDVGWVLADARPLPFYPCPGRLGFFKVKGGAGGKIQIPNSKGE